MYYSHFTATSPTMSVSQIIQGCTKIAKRSSLEIPKGNDMYNRYQDAKGNDDYELCSDRRNDGIVYEQGFSVDYVKGRGDSVGQYYRIEKYRDRHLSLSKEKLLLSSSNKWQGTVSTNASTKNFGGDGEEYRNITMQNNEIDKSSSSASSTSEAEKVPKKNVKPLEKKKLKTKRKKVKRRRKMKTNIQKNVKKVNESILDVSQPKVKEPSKEVLDNVNHNNSYIKKKAKTVNNKKLLKKNLKHIGNYLTPTFATVMKKTKKVRLPNVLEQVPFIAGQSSNRSHNLAARLQENKILDKINGSRTDTNLQINKIDSILSNQMHMINNIKRKRLIQRMDTTPTDDDVINNGLIIKKCDKNKLIKDVIQRLQKKFSEDINRQEELEFKIETKTDCSPEVIEEFKDLCEKMEEDENTIRALLSLIDDVKKKKDINFIVLLVNDILNLNVRFVHYDVPELGSPNYVRCVH
ncbi:uncharacterized protein isoform X3 [Rhodnius prolixus]|uniref:uncharacterized protein isoform X3 n=1 Tax=Rhodnius prolixus TaxID=13249 RepID=UPI003D18E786